MSKMMMGQIDHAKNRVAELKKEKYGDSVKRVNIKDGENLLKELRNGEWQVTGTAIKQAFDNFVNELPGPTVNKKTGNYQNNYEAYYTIVNVPATSVEDALATIVYRVQNLTEITRWEDETELYNTRKEAIDIKATQVEDAIVLGDQHAALLALQDFAAFEV